MKTFKEHFINEAKDISKEFEKLDTQLADIVKKMGPVYSKLLTLQDSADEEIYNNSSDRLAGIEKLRAMINL
jgi:archaellum component FlaC